MQFLQAPIKLFVSITLVSSMQMLVAQTMDTLPSLCLKARCDTQKIAKFTSDPAAKTDLGAFSHTVSDIHVEWSTLLGNDKCNLGGCQLNTPEVKMSMVLTSVNGLTSKLMMVRDLEIPNDLDEMIKAVMVSIERNCPAKSITPADCTPVTGPATGAPTTPANLPDATPATTPDNTTVTNEIPPTSRLKK